MKLLLAVTASVVLGASALAQTSEAGYQLPAKGQTVGLDQVQAITRQFELHELWVKIEKDLPINAFVGDGCSGRVEKWDGVSHYQACFLHDLKYWAGYPNEKVVRLRADQTKSCLSTFTYYFASRRILKSYRKKRITRE